MKTVLISGASAVGKTALVKHLIPYFKQANMKPCICKIDCLATNDDEIYETLHVPYVIGLSNDICPDHFLVSNLYELNHWANDLNADLLCIETAGLCSRCSPATNKTIHICVADCTASMKTPEKLGPMLSQADAIVLTKVDLVSLAEQEIMAYQISKINPTATIFFIDGVVGYGVELIANYIKTIQLPNSDEEHRLRHTMLSGVCSYCIGETRIGNAFQQGVVGKIDFRKAVTYE